MFELQYWAYHGMQVSIVDTTGCTHEGRMEIHKYTENKCDGTNDFSILPENPGIPPVTLSKSDVAKIEIVGLKLWEYEGKRIKVTSIDGQVLFGFGDHYTSGIDNPDGIPTLSLDPDDQDGVYIEFKADEIASIEVLPVTLPIMAKAV